VNFTLLHFSTAHKASSPVIFLKIGALALRFGLSFYNGRFDWFTLVDGSVGLAVRQDFGRLGGGLRRCLNFWCGRLANARFRLWQSINCNEIDDKQRLLTVCVRFVELDRFCNRRLFRDSCLFSRRLDIAVRQLRSVVSRRSAALLTWTAL
jgi:hypothetical protein